MYFVSQLSIISTSYIVVKLNYINNVLEGISAPLKVYWHSVQLLAMDQLQMTQRQTASTVLPATQQNIQG